MAQGTLIGSYDDVATFLDGTIFVAAGIDTHFDEVQLFKEIPDAIGALTDSSDVVHCWFVDRPNIESTGSGNWTQWGPVFRLLGYHGAIAGGYKVLQRDAERIMVELHKHSKLGGTVDVQDRNQLRADFNAVMWQPFNALFHHCQITIPATILQSILAPPP